MDKKKIEEDLNRVLTAKNIEPLIEGKTYSFKEMRNLTDEEVTALPKPKHITQKIHEVVSDLKRQYRKIEYISLSVSAFEEFQSYHLSTTGSMFTLGKDNKIMGYTFIVHPQQTSDVVALQNPLEEWLQGRKP